MQYDELTVEQKTALDAWLQIMRPLSGQIQRTVAGSVPIDDDWNASVSAIVALLDPGALVPNNSGLPASPVTREDIEASAVTLSDLLAQLNTSAVRQRSIRMAGLVNVAGN